MIYKTTNLSMYKNVELWYESKFCSKELEDRSKFQTRMYLLMHYKFEAGHLVTQDILR